MLRFAQKTVDFCFTLLDNGIVNGGQYVSRI